MKRISVLAAFCLLSGCAALQPAPAPAPDPLAAPDAVLAEAVNAARAPVPEQKLALARAQQAFLAEASVLNRLRLAALLATLPAPLRDDARATELLEPIVDVSAPGAGRLAALLWLQAAERQRLARELERMQRDAERATKERERLNIERERADKERDKREELLRQQLDALRSIERGIIDREERLRRRQR